jgi:beta-1,4-mannosyltransferase
MRANSISAPLCFAAKLYESFFGRYADYHLTVSKAMKTDLSQKFRIPMEKISVLYDRAVQGKFRKLDDLEKCNFLAKVGLQNVFMKKQGDNVTYVEDRPILLLTSTSYTPDEDLGLLVDALIRYSKLEGLPRLHLIVTGTGPLKSLFIQTFTFFN